MQHIQGNCDKGKEYTDQQINNYNTKFLISQPAMVKNHPQHTFDPKYLLDYKVLKVINGSTVFIISQNVK